MSWTIMWQDTALGAADSSEDNHLHNILLSYLQSEFQLPEYGKIMS